jgi:hypothetical protein
MGKLTKHIFFFFGSLLQRFGNAISIFGSRIKSGYQLAESFTGDRMRDTSITRRKDMNLEREICRKVYDHHGILKSEIATALLDICSRAGLKREDIAIIVTRVDATVDTSTSRMVADYQKIANAVK